MSGYHSPQLDVAVRLNTNESPLPPPDGWFRAMERSVGNIEPHRYPDRNAMELRRRIGSLHGVGPENVWVANGSNEIIQTLVLAFGGTDKRAVVFQPTYAMHSHIPNLLGTEVATVNRADDFTIRPATLETQAPGADLLFLCSPNNPTGTVESPENIASARRLARGIVIVDEAYGQFASWSAVDLIDEDQPLCVTRTFSKTWAMAGLRLGYVVAPTWMIESLQAATLPYHLSSLTQAAGIAALDFQTEMQERVDMLVGERDRIYNELQRIDVDTWPSGANFLLFRPRTVPGPGVWQRLVDQSVLVRDTGSWDGLAGCLRVTVGSKSENDAFLTALQQSL